MKKSAVLLFLLIALSRAQAQCSQCKAVAESGLKNGSTLSDIDQSFGRGLNSGILFLALIPYLILSGIVWYFFGKKIKQKVKSLLHKS